MQILRNRLFIVLYLVIQCAVSQNFTEKNNDFLLLTTTKNFVAGSNIQLVFQTNRNETIQMLCTNSYGSSLIDSSKKNDKIVFKIPSYLSNKIGILNWRIIDKKAKVTGQITIIAKEKPNTIETYLGPPSIEAGNIDYTMITAIPTDDLDNPLKENTDVKVATQFLAVEKTETISTENLIAFKNIYAPLKSGRMIVSSEVKGLNSKEFDVNIMPAIATNFKITFNRNHEYADGNQITSIYTSIIKDRNNNVVSDGTFVLFFIKNKNGDILKTSGTTINGIATAKIIHPDFEDEWSVQAYITGIAESNVIKIGFKRVIKAIDVQFSKSNREIIVGPLKSFMNQLIPDGLQVKLDVYIGDKLQNQMIKTSRNGIVRFYLNPNIYNNGVYKLVISTAGITKKFDTKKLW